MSYIDNLLCVMMLYTAHDDLDIFIPVLVFMLNPLKKNRISLLRKETFNGPDIVLEVS